MAKTYQQIMDEARQQVPEVSPDDVRARLGAASKPVVLDVREKEEFRQGYLPGAVSLPRGFLEMRVEETVPDKSTPIVAYCAGGTRSLLAGRILKELGYQDVVSMRGGFTAWKNQGLPDHRGPPVHRRAADPLQPPLPAARGRRGGAGEAARRQGAAASAPAASARRRRSTWRRRASARSASSTWTSSICRTCSARSCTPTTASACRRSSRRA